MSRCYYRPVKVSWPKLRLAVCLVALTLAGVGCSGINATQSVSPLDFLLPGAGKLLHLQNSPPVTPLGTNDCLASEPLSFPSVSLEAEHPLSIPGGAQERQ